MLIAQPAMKSIPHMLIASDDIVTHLLSIFWMMFLEMGSDFSLCWVSVACWLSMSKNWLLVGWACAKIGYSLAEHAQNLVTCWLSMRENWLLVSWACAKIGYSFAEHALKSFVHHLHFLSFSSLPLSHPFPCPLLLFLSNVFCPLSHVFVLCLPSYVPCLMAVLLVSCPLSPVSRLCSLSPVLCILSINCPSVPYLWLYSIVHVLCSSVSCPLFLQVLSSCPLFFILRMRVFLNNIHAFTWWLATSRYCTCPLSPSHVFVLCLPSYDTCLRPGYNVRCQLSDNF